MAGNMFLKQKKTSVALALVKDAPMFVRDGTAKLIYHVRLYSKGSKGMDVSGLREYVRF